MYRMDWMGQQPGMPMDQLGTGTGMYYVPWIMASQLDPQHSNRSYGTVCMWTPQECRKLMDLADAQDWPAIQKMVESVSPQLLHNIRQARMDSVHGVLNRSNTALARNPHLPQITAAAVKYGVSWRLAERVLGALHAVHSTQGAAACTELRSGLDVLLGVMVDMLVSLPTYRSALTIHSSLDPERNTDASFAINPRCVNVEQEAYEHLSGEDASCVLCSKAYTLARDGGCAAMYRTECGHTMCTICTSKWVGQRSAARHNATCPFCRRDI